MAKEAKPEAEAVVAAAPKKSKKLLIIVAAVLVVVLLIAGGGAFWLMKKHNASADEEADTTGEPAAKVEKKSDGKEAAPPVYVALDAFTVNLVGDQFLQLIVSVEVSDLHVGDKLKNFTPKIRNNVMLLLSSKNASDLLTKEGKETLANEIRDIISEIVEPGAKGRDSPIKEVLFTSFIIQ